MTVRNNRCGYESRSLFIAVLNGVSPELRLMDRAMGGRIPTATHLISHIMLCRLTLCKRNSGINVVLQDGCVHKIFINLLLKQTYTHPY